MATGSVDPGCANEQMLNALKENSDLTLVRIWSRSRSLTKPTTRFATTVQTGSQTIDEQRNKLVFTIRV